MRVEAMTKMRYDRSLNNANASTPKIFPIVRVSSLLSGGVFGRKKLTIPRMRAALAVRKNMLTVVSQFIKVKETPAAIHPIVPNTRM
jgi:hypothetical protein